MAEIPEATLRLLQNSDNQSIMEFVDQLRPHHIKTLSSGELCLWDTELGTWRTHGTEPYLARFFQFELPEIYVQHGIQAARSGLFADAVNKIIDVSDQLRNARKVASLIRCAKQYYRTTCFEPNREPALLAFENGLLHFDFGEQTVQFRKVEPADHISLRIPYSFPSPHIDQYIADLEGSDEWQYLDDLLVSIFARRDTIDYFLALHSICMFAPMREQFFVLWSGPQCGSGKAVLAELFEHSFQGHFGILTGAQIVCSKMQSGGGVDAANSSLANLIDRRIAFVADIPEGVELDYARVKAFASGDPIPYRRKRQNAAPESKRPMFTLVIMSNSLPLSDDAYKPFLANYCRTIPFDAQLRSEYIESVRATIRGNPRIRSAFMLMLLKSFTKQYLQTDQLPTPPLHISEQFHRLLAGPTTIDQEEANVIQNEHLLAKADCSDHIKSLFDKVDRIRSIRNHLTRCIFCAYSVTTFCQKRQRYVLSFHLMHRHRGYGKYAYIALHTCQRTGNALRFCYDRLRTAGFTNTEERFTRIIPAEFGGRVIVNKLRDFELSDAFTSRSDHARVIAWRIVSGSNSDEKTLISSRIKDRNRRQHGFFVSHNKK